MTGKTSQERRTLPNYYLALDITPGVSHNEILHAYNRSKNTYANGSLASYGLLEGDSAQSILSEIEEAFNILGNPARRRDYDMKMGFHQWTGEDEEPTRPSDGPSIVTQVGRQSRGSNFVSNDASPVTVVAPKPAPIMSVAPTSKVSAPVSFASETIYERNPEFEQQIRDCKEVDGAFLKAVRIYRGLTVDQLAQRCKLSSSHIDAIENENGNALPQAVYLRGHAYLMSQALELPDPETLATGFIQRMRQLGKLPRAAF